MNNLSLKTIIAFDTGNYSAWTLLTSCLIADGSLLIAERLMVMAKKKSTLHQSNNGLKVKDNLRYWEFSTLLSASLSQAIKHQSNCVWNGSGKHSCRGSSESMDWGANRYNRYWYWYCVHQLRGKKMQQYSSKSGNILNRASGLLLPSNPGLIFVETFLHIIYSNISEPDAQNDHKETENKSSYREVYKRLHYKRNTQRQTQPEEAPEPKRDTKWQQKTTKLCKADKEMATNHRTTEINNITTERCKMTL